MNKTIHRHIVFTIDECLRELFLLHREKLLEGLMDKSAKIIKEDFNKKGIEPCINLGLLTFGLKLESNTHIHMIEIICDTLYLAHILSTFWWFSY